MKTGLFKRILAETAYVYGVAESDILGPSRAIPLPECRMMICYLMHEMEPFRTHGEVAGYLNRERTLVIYARKKIADYIVIYPEVKKRYKIIKESIHHEHQAN
jgi:chromosomal replication initiation ATPase DnaA